MEEGEGEGSSGPSCERDRGGVRGGWGGWRRAGDGGTGVLFCGYGRAGTVVRRSGPLRLGLWGMAVCVELRG